MNCVFINQSVAFPKSGTYQLAIMDINPNDSYKSIHIAYINVTIK
jgi:hypothetical protein